MNPNLRVLAELFDAITDDPPCPADREFYENTEAMDAHYGEGE